jgi:hypothetical protein
MRVICKGNRGSDLAEDVLSRSGNTIETIFHVTLGCEYPVYGMALWAAGLAILTIDDTEKTHWHPLALFDLVEHGLPREWHFGVVDGEGVRPVRALWGYPTLIHDANHHDDLIDRKIPALRMFLRECDRSDHTPLDERKIAVLDRVVAEWLDGSPA